MDEKERVADLQKQFGRLEERRRPYKDVWTDISKFVLPRRALMDWNREKRGEYRTDEIFDGTAVHALALLADGLQGYLTSPSTTWFALMFGDESLNRHKMARRWVQEVERIMYTIFQRSNFYDIMNEIFLDGGSIGTATLYIEEDIERGNINFMAMHPKEIFIAQNRIGKVDTVFRKFYLTNREARKFFGEQAFDEKDLKVMKEKPYEDEIYYHAVYPREDREHGKRDKKNKPFASCYWQDGDDKFLKEGGYDDLPYIVWRWRVSSEEEYGRSPAWDALSEIKRSQVLGETMTDSAQLSVQPPIQYPEKHHGRIMMKPRGMNPYRNPNELIYPMEVGGNYPVGRDREEAIQQAIVKHFRVDFFIWLANMTQQTGNMTATEVMERQGEKAAVLGAIIGRINSELLDPIFDAVFRIASNAGWLPPLPQQLQAYAGAPMKIEYLGPLAQAQKRFYSTQGVSQALSQILPLLDVYPSMRHRINSDALAKHLLTTNGMPEKIINDDKTVAQMRQQEARQQQQQQQMIQAEQAAEMASKAPQSVSEQLSESL